MNDIKHGSDITGVGTVLKKMGAHGVYSGNPEAVGDFMASLPLGLLRATKGAGEVTQSGQTWQGTKDIVGGGLQAATIPSAFIAPQGAEAAAAAPGKVAGAISKALPSFERAGEALNAAEQAAGKMPVKVTDELSQAASDLFQQKDFASQVPRVAQKLYARLTDPDLPELNYADARKFYSNISRLSADEMNKMNPVTKRLMGALRVALNDAIQQTADAANVGEQYQQGMAGYRSAAKFAERKELAASLAKKAAGAVALGTVAGAAAKKYGPELSEILGGR